MVHRPLLMRGADAQNIEAEGLVLTTLAILPKKLILTRKLTILSESKMPFSKVQGKKNDHKVIVYALSTCVWCKMTKQFLKDNYITYEYIDVDLCEPEEKDLVHQQILSRGGTLNYPTVIIDDKKLIQGFRKDKLKEALEI